MPTARAFLDRLLFGRHPLGSSLQRVMQRLLRGPREVTFEFKKGPAAGYTFSCLSSHRYFFARDDYERELLKPTEAMVRPDSIVYDIGAHFGFWAIVLSRLCPQGKVFAFEPCPGNCAWLRKNVAMNSIKNIQIVPFALSDRIGTSHLSHGGSMATISDGAPNVETTTVDEFCKTHLAPNLMLIDVEGHASEVLRGASALLAHSHVPIICEIHSEPEEKAVLEIKDTRRPFPYRAILNGAPR